MKTILIAPFDSPLAEALASEARAAGWTIAVAVRDPGGSGVAVAVRDPTESGPEAASEGKPGQESPENLRLQWNPASFVSASALVLAARNALGKLDAAVLISDPSSIHADLLGDRPGELEAAIGEASLGPALLSRELARRFDEKKEGSLLLITPEPPEDASLGPIAALSAGAFRGLGDGLFQIARDRGWTVFGVADRSGSPEMAARFAIKLLDERKSGKSGRWLRFGGKPGIFGMF